MKKLLSLITGILSLCPNTVSAQTTHNETPARPWETIIGNMMDDSDEDAANWEEMYDALYELENSPVDINTATKEDLERLPFLSDDEIADILEYIYRNGEMKSLAELSMIRSLNTKKRQLLPFFITIKEQTKSGFPTMKNILKYGTNEFLATANIPLYERKGDKNGYLGYKYKHNIRYEHKYGDYLRLGFVGAQDAGEPFFSNKNSLGYDFYSFYLAIKKLGRIKSLTLGRYRIRLGMGLTMNNDLSLSKSMSLNAINRQGGSIRPHSSRSGYNYMQGAAATIRLTQKLDLTAFVSYKDFDATLNNDDGSIATILKSDYHRTQAELNKKNNSSQFVSGGSLNFSDKGFTLGISGYYAWLNRQLKPNKTQEYRKHYAEGQHFYNYSIDYGYRNGNFSLHGETATGNCKAWATINTIAYRLRQNLSVMALQRFYSYRYYSLFAQSFSEGGSVQNESGVYLGVDWQPLRKLSVAYYTDIAYFPWAKYQAHYASRSFDNMLSVVYASNNWTITAKYRLKMREKDNADKTALIYKTDQRARLATAYTAPLWTIKAQIDAAHSKYKDKSFGYMTTISGGCTAIKKLNLYATLGYFHTQDYNSRIYSYERGMLYDFSFPSYYGEGIRYAVIASCNSIKNITLTAKAGTTNYFDRSKIGSSLQQIDHSSATDILLQMKWKF